MEEEQNLGEGKMDGEPQGFILEPTP